MDYNLEFEFIRSPGKDQAIRVLMDSVRVAIAASPGELEVVSMGPDHCWCSVHCFCKGDPIALVGVIWRLLKVSDCVSCLGVTVTPLT